MHKINHANWLNKGTYQILQKNLIMIKTKEKEKNLKQVCDAS